MAQDDLRSTLEDVGDRFDLGEYEIEAYLVVLEHGELTASEIADRTEIPQPRVYDTVRSLGDRGLVELRESRPMTVVAIDPGEAFEELERSLTDMVERLEAQFTAPARETEAVTLVRSRSTILRYLEDVIGSASFELSLSLTPSLLEYFEEGLADATDRGVSVDLIVTPASEAPSAGAYDYERVATNVRHRRGVTTPVLAVADGVYSIYATRDAVRGDRDRYGVIFNRSALGFLLSGFYSTVLWTSSEAVLTRAPEETFPRCYASIRRCVRDLQHVDGAAYAAIRGRDVLSGDDRTVRGEVVETALETPEQLAALVVSTDEDERVSIGGQVAALEDVEAHAIRIARDDHPPLPDARADH